MNPILALAIACAATNPPLMRDLERMQPRPVKPQTKADLDRIEAAQMKRSKRQLKRTKKKIVMSTVTSFNYDLSDVATGDINDGD